MDAEQRNYLAQAEQEMRLAKHHVERQRARLGELRKSGQPTDEAERLLATFEEVAKESERTHRDVLLMIARAADPKQGG